jgi:hypothetical protein
MIVDDEAFNILALEGLMRILGLKDIKERVDKCYNGEQSVDLVK